MQYKGRIYSYVVRLMFAILIFVCSSGEVAAFDGTGLRNVRIGYYSLSNVQDRSWNKAMYDSVYQGYGYEYMLAVGQYAGWNCQFLHLSYDEGIRMLESGGIDIMCRVERTPRLEGIFAFVTADSRRRYQASEYYAVRKENTVLLQELTAAMDELQITDPSFGAELYEKYYGRGRGTVLMLTPAEKDYILQHSVVRVAYDPLWYPISYRDNNGQFAGAMAKIYEKIAERTGLQFEFEPADNFSEALSSFEEGRTELLAELPYDFLWADKHKASLTIPCQNISIVAAFRPGNMRMHTVAVPPDYYQQYLSETIRKDSYEFHNYRTSEGCLDAVLNGEVDCALLNSYQMEYYRKLNKYNGMSFRVMPALGYRLGTAVSRQADPRLRSIIMKALEGMGSAEMDQIFRDAAQMRQQAHYSDMFYANVWLVATGVMLLFSLTSCVLLYRQNRRMMKLLKRRRGGE